MGCCVSTTTKSTRESYETSGDQLVPLPPPQLEEETVKEVVLSETPMPNSTPTNLHKDMHGKYGTQQSNAESTVTMNVPTNPTVVVKPIEETIPIFANGNSELVSLNENLSPAPKPVPEKFVVNDEEVTENLMAKRKNSVQVTAAKVIHRRSPARRPVEEISEGQNRVQGWSGEPPDPASYNRRYSGQSAGRRLTPETFREVDKGKNVMDKDLNFSEGGFSGHRSPEKFVNGNVELHGKFNGEVSPENDSGESLENPLVSLECFIFL